MKIEPFSTRWAGVVTHWLIEEENWKSLELGVSAQKLDPITFRNLSRQPKHEFYLYFDEKTGQPIGLVALSDINKTSKTARLWYMLGEKEFVQKGYTAKAVNECLKQGFNELGLTSIYVWIVKKNAKSGQVLESNFFNYIGCRRHCHPLDGTIYDRYLYDLLASEFQERNSRKPEKKKLSQPLPMINPTIVSH
ncbi:MAG: GNAT family protein [Balneolaceae bacterium]